MENKVIDFPSREKRFKRIAAKIEKEQDNLWKYSHIAISMGSLLPLQKRFSERKRLEISLAYIRSNMWSVIDELISLSKKARCFPEYEWIEGKPYHRDRNVQQNNVGGNK